MADNKQVVRPGSYLKRERDIVQKATTVTLYDNMFFHSIFHRM